MKLNHNRVIELNNGNKIVEQFNQVLFPNEISTVRLTESGTNKFPYITDENIKNNASFLLNIFNESNNKQKKLVKMDQKKRNI